MVEKNSVATWITWIEHKRIFSIVIISLYTRIHYIISALIAKLTMARYIKNYGNRKNNINIKLKLMMMTSTNEGSWWVRIGPLDIKSNILIDSIRFKQFASIQKFSINYVKSLGKLIANEKSKENCENLLRSQFCFDPFSFSYSSNTIKKL